MPGDLQTTSCRYLRRDNLQDLLERLFPGQTDFGIMLLEDQWIFTAPRIVDPAELDSVQDD
ncbi:hypothetical protein N7501_009337 [Penicillium viridicatum]|nr:hypothetical protein N7501_009337 [Penicillium viridicatum]